MLDTIVENFKFLALEVENQVKLTEMILDRFNEDDIDKIGSKDDYIDNLKTTVENLCFSRIHGADYVDEKEINAIRAVHIICLNLERIADYCVNITRQTDYLSDGDFIHRFEYAPLFFEIHQALGKITTVFKRRDLSGALDICRAEFHLDRMWKFNFDRIMESLNEGKNVGDLITTLFIFRYLERIGDSILNIGEALIFVIIGDRIKIRQFEALQKTLTESGFDGNLSDIEFSSIWGSRSGCRIGKVNQDDNLGTKAQAIFKEGVVHKIKSEMQNIKRWDEIYPGLAPRIFGYYEKSDKASMLVEFLEGCTLDELFLTDDRDIIENVIFVFEQTLADIWESTQIRQPVQIDYMKQLSDRLDAVYRVHPTFKRTEKQIDRLTIPSTRWLIDRCQRIEKKIQAPFTVFIHGDFNINNILYNHGKEKINYIDLYRSRDADYIQDASVFLISNFRIPIFDPKIRLRLNEIIHHFYKVFKGFADTYEDDTFEIRMALALARSFLTSSRFELNYHFAGDMVLRSHYLMEKVIAHPPDPWDTFRLPIHILYY